MLVFLVNLVYSLAIARTPSPQNPWRSRGLEFQLPVPIPEHDFDRIPTIQGGPYDYGLPDAVPALGNGADPGALR